MPTFRTGVQKEDIDVLEELYEDVRQQGLAETLTTSSLHLDQKCFYISLSCSVHDELELIDLIVASLQTCLLEEGVYAVVYDVEVEG